MRVKEILQEKAVFLKPQTDDQPEKHVIKGAELPKHPIPRSAVTTDMLAYIIIAKFCDALPLYPLEVILDRYGGSVTRTTMDHVRRKFMVAKKGGSQTGQKGEEQ